MILRVTIILSLFLVAASCASPQSPKTIAASDTKMPQLVGRWVFSPGDSSLAQETNAEKSRIGGLGALASAPNAGNIDAIRVTNRFIFLPNV